MIITHDGRDYDFEKWPKWRQLDTSIELLVLDGESVLEYQREGSSLYLFMEGGMVHQDDEETAAVGLLVIELVGVSDESFGGEQGPPAAACEIHLLTGSIPILRQTTS